MHMALYWALTVVGVPIIFTSCFMFFGLLTGLLSLGKIRDGLGVFVNSGLALAYTAYRASTPHPIPLTWVTSLVFG
jgi:hypothetical protein